jgi:hypothetical protein
MLVKVPPKTPHDVPETSAGKLKRTVATRVVA